MPIKKSIARYQFRTELARKKNRNKAFVSLADAKLVGILYDADIDTEKQTAQKLAETLRSQKKEVLLLGFMYVKKFPPNLHITYGTEYFNRSHLNWAGMPVHQHLDNFLRTEFDYLINLHSSESLRFNYLVGKSKAKCKVGSYSPRYKDVYDLMVDTKSHSPDEFVKQVLHYLQKIG